MHKGFSLFRFLAKSSLELLMVAYDKEKLKRDFSRNYSKWFTFYKKQHS